MRPAAERSLVTGGAGFVGRHLVDALLAKGDRVRVIDRSPSSPRVDVDYRQGDITDPKAVRDACSEIDVVYHAASMVQTRRTAEDLVWRVNLGGTENVLAACRTAGVKRLVYVSSGSVVYEGRDICGGDEALPYARTSQAPYADSKIAAERVVLAANEAAALRTCALRPHVIFGPGDQRFMPALLAASRSGRLRFQVGRGTWLSDYTYVSNLVDALLLAADALRRGSAAGEAYFITNGEPMPFWDFVRAVIDRLGLPPIRFRLPYRLVYAIAAIKEWGERLRGRKVLPEDGLTRFAIRYMCTHHYFSIDKARRDLGYDPAVSIAEGIDRTCAALGG